MNVSQWILDKIPRSPRQKSSTQILYILSVFSRVFCIEFIKIKNFSSTGKKFQWHTCCHISASATEIFYFEISRENTFDRNLKNNKNFRMKKISVALVQWTFMCRICVIGVPRKRYFVYETLTNSSIFQIHQK